MIVLKTYSTAMVLVACCMVLGSCTFQQDELKYGEVYYSTFDHLHFPIKPLRPISQQEALSRSVYYVGNYDHLGRLVRFEKNYKGSVFFRFDYSYHTNGKVKLYRKLLPDGKTIVSFFDTNGNKTRSIGMIDKD